MMEAASTSEMLVNFFQSTQHSNPEDSHVQGSVFEKDRKSVEVCVSPCSLRLCPELASILIPSVL
jgi:hypothetical protein